MGLGAGMRLVAWQPRDLMRHLDEAITVYGEAMGYPRDLIDTRKGYVAAHTHRPDFRAVATLRDGDDQLLGFGYGYRSTPGQWWHDQVAGALGRDLRKWWLSDCFELVELHVKPDAQGRGLGARQLSSLLEDIPHRTVVLSTPEADESKSRAWRLYRRFGFVDILRHFNFPGDERPFAVLGRQLPL
ncbi:acetyltransferase [Virgisporangium aliadipatigenens]|uniref:Acetyltransferase n=2 Tax=Virgisporangium aliadipatigenens TaxID=741659 RepID=A0A8J3YSW3_9ACTN|nr:acetyltransferase [Virgisporangium aliadipatigenens]